MGFCAFASALAGVARNIETNFPITEPYAPLHGGAFTGPAVEESPDPLQQFRWRSTAISNDLQVFWLHPISATATDPGAFSNFNSATNKECQITVNGAGSLRFDFGVESAAWLEFDSPDLSGSVEASISEFNQSTSPAIPSKTGKPIRHGNTYRLELNNELYEGVRFGWIHVRQFDRPWHITAVRLACQTRPVNYTGSFACSDPGLTRIWYTSAYAVKLNLLKDYLGAILMNRGDRFSWTGDAHVAQAAALVAFGNWDFIAHNIDRTANDSNDIASYALYWVLSVLEYYQYTGDTAEVAKHWTNMVQKLDQGMASYANPRITFYGWDERLGAGFENAECAEAKRAYRMLFIHTCREFANTADTLGRSQESARYRALTEKLVSELRRDSQWHESFGIHAAADAINAGFASNQEAGAMRQNQFGDRVQRISFSPFNEYFLLNAMSRLGQHDEALTAVRDCWGGQIDYGGTTFFECYDPSWNAFLKPNDPIPSCQAGGTSLCHPWSSGVTKWLTEEVLGIKPTAPGFTTVAILPHLGSTLTRVSGSVPTPRGSVEAAFDVQSGKCQVTLPPATVGSVGIPKTGRNIVKIQVNGDTAWNKTFSPVPGIASASDTPEYIQFEGLQPGNYNFQVTYEGQRPSWQEPPMTYPLSLQGIDTTTQGDWGGKYGRDGYVLFGYDGNGKDRAQLPSYVQAVTPSVTKSRLDTIWQSGTNERRALAPSITNDSPRNAACTYGTIWFSDLTVHVDVDLKTNTTYNLALYFVDWDRKDRSLSVQVRDRKTLNLIAPIQMISDFTGGKYLIFHCDRSVRLRLDPVRGDNAVLSGLFFDPAPQQ